MGLYSSIKPFLAYAIQQHPHRGCDVSPHIETPNQAMIYILPPNFKEILDVIYVRWCKLDEDVNFMIPFSGDKMLVPNHLAYKSTKGQASESMYNSRSKLAKPNNSETSISLGSKEDRALDHLAARFGPKRPKMIDLPRCQGLALFSLKTLPPNRSEWLHLYSIGRNYQRRARVDWEGIQL
ncbi:hypothetical protein ACFE04_004548 [Oxalis oulophora]